jgi:hypothetical protein
MQAACFRLANSVRDSGRYFDLLLSEVSIVKVSIACSNMYV